MTHRNISNISYLHAGRCTKRAKAVPKKNLGTVYATEIEEEYTENKKGGEEVISRMIKSPRVSWADITALTFGNYYYS